MKGIDISNHNGNIDFIKVKNDGIELVYIKATEGTTYQDPLLNQHYQGAIAAGLKTGFYHFLVGTSQPETQAENFYDQIKDKQNSLKACLDIEKIGFNVMDYALRFIAKFKELSDLQLCIYASPFFINDNLDNRLSSYSLWVAHYGVEIPMSNNVWGGIYAGHQYTDKGSIAGIVGNVDMNNFNESILEGNSVPIQVINLDEVVKNLQFQCNLQGFSKQVVDGIVGSNTLKGCPLLELGAKGEITKCLQKLLNRHNYGLIEDGNFGGNTLNSVLNFQVCNNLSADGMVGQKTWSKLLGL